MFLFSALLPIPRIRGLESRGQVDACAPAQVSQSGGIQQFLRGAVRFRGVVEDRAGIADNGGDLLGQFADSDVAACADIEQVSGIGVQTDVDAGGGHVVHMQKFAPGGASAPEQDAGRDRGMGRNAQAVLQVSGNRAEAGDIAGDAGPVPRLGQLVQVEFADQRRQDVGSFQVEIVSTLAISCCGSELIQQDLPILGVKLVGFEGIR